MKFLYVLCSDSNDLYFEQALLSITSLRNKMPESHISLLTDNQSANELRNNGKRKIIFDLINEFKEFPFTEDKNKKYRSRWIKTSMRKHIDGDFLYLDCDTVIADYIKLNTAADLLSVLDIHLPLKKRLKNEHYREIHINRDESLGFITSPKNYYNGGIMFCRDVPVSHTFFDLWHKYWLSCVEKGISDDQPSLNMANTQLGNIITELDGTWNCQLVRSGIPYLGNAKIIHYFNASDNSKKYILAKANTYESIKKLGYIPNDIKKLLKHPRAAFCLGKNKTRYSFADKLLNIALIILFSFPLNLIFFPFAKIQRCINS